MFISQKKELMIMRYTITGRNIEVKQPLKRRSESWNTFSLLTPK